jgi:hypothetical protein
LLKVIYRLLFHRPSPSHGCISTDSANTHITLKHILL